MLKRCLSVCFKSSSDCKLRTGELPTQWGVQLTLTAGGEHDTELTGAAILQNGRAA
jgi:hypothetical protein